MEAEPSVWHQLIRFTEAVHLYASVNRFSSCCVKSLAACRPLGAEAATRLVHGAASWHSGRDN